MGNEVSTQPKKGSVPVYNKIIDKTKLEILLKKIFYTTQLHNNRKKGVVSQKEKELLGLIAKPKIQRNRDNESAKASAIVSDLKFVKAQECVMRYCDIVKDRALVIQMSKGDPSKISDLIPFIESIVWGCNNLNLECVKELEMFLHSVFGPEVYGILSKGQHVQPELRECFNSVLPSEKDIKIFLMEFCKKNSIEIELMNEIGHNISEQAIQELTIASNNTGGMGPHGGYPGGNDFPHGGFPSGGYPSGDGCGIGGGYPGGGVQTQYDPSKNLIININTNPYGGQNGGYGGQNGGYGGQNGGYGGQNGGYGGQNGGYGGQNGGYGGQTGGYGGQTGGYGGQPGGYGGQPGGFGGQPGGFGGQTGGFGGQTGSFGAGTSNSSNGSQNQYQPQPYQQQQYNPQNYQPQGHPQQTTQKGYPQQTTQQGYPQQTTQQGYPQQTTQQQGYTQQQHNAPYQPISKPSYDSPYSNINQVNSNNQNSIGSHNSSAPSQNQNVQQPSNQISAPNGVNFDSGDSSYPVFKKMDYTPAPNTGPGGNGEIDDFLARLKNIKDGL